MKEIRTRRLMEVLFAWMVLFAVMAVDATAGMVSMWKLNEGSGTSAGDFLETSDAIVSGAGWVAGRADSALDFDGTDDYMNCGDDASLVFSGKMTVAMWVKFSSLSGSSAVICQDPASYKWLIYKMNGTGNLSFYIKTASGTTSTGGVAFGDGKWHHLAATYDKSLAGNRLKLYKDGILEASGNGYDENISAATADLVLGYYGSSYFNGSVDEVRVYNNALSGADIYKIYSNENVLGSWRFAEGAGSIVVDSVGNCDGTVSGAAWVEGRVDSALDFDGTSDYVAVANDSGLNTGTDDFTVEVWAKYTENASSYLDAFLSKDNPSAWTTAGCRGYALGIDVYGRAYAFVWRGDDSWLKTACSVAQYDDGLWHHIVVVYDRDGDMSIYVDGEHAASEDISDNQSTLDSTGPFSIGERPGGVVFDGILDGIKVHAGALTLAEICEQHYNTDLAGYWDFDSESAAVAIDSSENKNNGIITGASRVGGAAGNDAFGNALSFDGTDDYVDCGSDKSLDVNTKISVTAWVKPAALEVATSILGKWQSGVGGYAIAMRSDRVMVVVKEWGRHFYSSYGALAAGKWTHIGVTVDNTASASSTVKIYIDGALQAQQTYSIDIPDAAMPFCVGKYPYNDLFNGAIDEVKVYNTVLSADEIFDNYTGGVNVGCWEFDSGSGASAVDSSGNGNTGTLTNMDTPAGCWADGRVGGALIFDGSNDYVDCGSGSSLNMGTGDFTVELWARYTDAGASHFNAFLAKDVTAWTSAGYRGYAVGVDASGRIYAWIWRGDDSWLRTACSSAAYNDGAWHHVVVVYDRDAYLTVYVDGSSVAQTDISGNQSSIDSTGSLTIARRDGSVYFAGEIDQINLFSTALSSTQVDQRFEGHGGAYGFGCEEQPTGNPVGGGAGYIGIYTTGDYVVDTSAELLSALSSAISGDVVFVSGDIDLTGEDNIAIADGVTLAGDRGYNGSSGAKLYDTSSTAANEHLFVAGESVRITGLRLQGPDPATSTTDYSDAIASSDPYLEVDNCEISAWGHAGIHLLDGGTGAYIHHNYIHHCQKAGEGYGISHGYGDATSVIEANKFDYTRHAIAATGTSGNSYEARYNLAMTNSNSSVFDVHGGADRQDGTNIAGDDFYIHHNTFQALEQFGVGIRGVPNNEALIHHNWFYDLGTYQSNAVGNMGVYMNLMTASRMLQKEKK